MSYEWDSKKNHSNIRKHGVDFADAVAVFEDEYSITVTDDSDEEESRFVTLGLDSSARPLVVVYTYRGEAIRIISARPAERQERRQYEDNL